MKKTMTNAGGFEERERGEKEKALEAAIEDTPNPECIEIGVAEVGKKFRRLDENEIKALLKKEKKKAEETA